MRNSKNLYFLVLICFCCTSLNVLAQELNSQIATEETAVEVAATEYELETETNVYLDFRETDIKEVARVLSKLSGKSILVSEGVNASVTVNLEDIPWRQALEIILKTYHLALMDDDDFLIIVSYDQVQTQEILAPLKTKIIPLNFADIESINEIIEGSLTERGTVRLDERTKSLIITDTQDVIDSVEKILESIDTSTPQVLIEVLMVDKKVLEDFDFGVNWTLLDTKLSEGFVHTRPGGLGEQALPWETFKYFEQPFDLFTNEAFSMGVSSMVGDDLLSVIVDMWEQENIATVLANPRVLTLDNEEATIEIIERIPYQEIKQTSEGATLTGTTFMEIGVTMTVAPQITQDGHIILNLVTEQEFETGRSDTNVPIVDSRKSESKMMVENEATIVIGGLRRKNKNEQVSKIPILGDLPLVGALFSQTSIDETLTELIIFVTPTIYKDGMPLTEFRENEAKKVREQELENEELEATEKEEKDNEQTNDDEFYFLEEEHKTTPQKTKEYAEEIKAIELDPSFDTLEMLPLRSPY